MPTCYRKKLLIILNDNIIKLKNILTQLIMSSRLKYKVDKFVRYVNNVNIVIFTKTSNAPDRMC